MRGTSQLTPKRRQTYESAGQMSFLDDLDRLIDQMLDEAQPGEVTWTDTEISKLKQGILIDALKTLRQGRLSLSVRTELNEWISEPLPDAGIPARPFSFADCAVASDFAPEELQPRLLTMLPKLH